MQQINFHISSLKNIDWTGYTSELKNLSNYSGDKVLQNEIKSNVSKVCEGKNFLFVNSGTSALELALMSLKLNNDDEVIVPSYTFSSCANAVIRANAKPVFCDVELKNLHASINTILPLISNKTKCIMIVEYGGIRANIGPIRKICDDKGIILVLDSAQSFGATNKKYDETYLADFVCYSFHDTKNFSCGEGGLLIINNEFYLNDAQIMYEKGTNRLEFMRGKVEKYSWCDIGSSFILSNVNLLLLNFQLKIIDEIILKKFEAIEVYMNFLKKNNYNYIKAYSEHLKCSNRHIFWIILNNIKTRDELIKHFNSFKIEATTHYVPLHSSELAMKSGFKYSKDMRVTNLAGNCLIRLPVISADISRKVADVISKFYPGKNV